MKMLKNCVLISSLILCFSCKEATNSSQEKKVIFTDTIDKSKELQMETTEEKPKIQEEKLKPMYLEEDSSKLLSLVSFYSLDSIPNFSSSEDDIGIDSILHIEGTQRSLFNTASKIDFIKLSINNYKRSNILYLPQDKEGNYIELADRKSNTVSCDDKIYTYYGKIKLLNSYLVGYMSCDLYVYELINKSSGNSLGSLVGYPFVSPKGSTVVSIGVNHFEINSTMQIHTISDNKLEKKYEFTFPYWIPFGDRNDIDIRWIDDETFVIKVISTRYLQSIYEKNKKKPFYIKIKIL